MLFSRKDLEDFQRTHIIAATREVRPDIVRALFQYMKVARLFGENVYFDKGPTRHSLPA